MATYEDMLASMAAGGARRRAPARRRAAAYKQPPGLRAYAKFRAAHPGMSQAQVSAKWHRMKGSGLVGGCGDEGGMMMGGEYDDMLFRGVGSALVGGKGRKKAVRAKYAAKYSGDPGDPDEEDAREQLKEAYKLARYNWTCPPFYRTDPKSKGQIGELIDALKDLKAGYEKKPKVISKSKALADNLSKAILATLERGVEKKE